MTRKKGKLKFSMSKLGRVPFKRKGRKRFIFNSNKRGLWPTHQYVREDDPVAEENTKNALCPNSGIDVTKIDNMIKGSLTREEELLRKYYNKEDMNKIDTMRINHILEKIDRDIKRDIDGINISRFNHKPITKEGSFMIKMLWLDRFIKKDMKEKIAHIYLKIKDDLDDLSKMKFPEELKALYQSKLNNLNLLVSSYDMIDLQLGPLSDSVVPLNQKGFKKLEDFQVKVIQIIQENEKIKNKSKKKSILVKAPTSAGKTALAGYLFTKKGRFIVSVPTNALAWQLTAMISKIVGYSIPLVTDTYQSALKTADLVKLIISSNCVVGTPTELVNILALPDFKDISFDYMLFDEIHMLGKEEGAWMEALIKGYPETPILALSATIGNEEELAQWIRDCGRENVEVITYEKRFINLQRFMYRNKLKQIERINPLSMIDIDDFKTGVILDKTIIPTQQDAYIVYKTLREKYPKEVSLQHEDFFSKDKRISLDDILAFFNHHLKFMVKQVQSNDDIMLKIIESFKLDDFEEEEINVTDLLFTLKDKKMCPAIMFHENEGSVMDFAYQVHKEAINRENKKYPKLMEERRKHNKKFKQQQKKDDKDDTMKRINDSKKLSDKLEIKMMQKISKEEKEGERKERVAEKDIFEPHRDFIFTDHQFNSKSIVQSWEYSVNPNKDKFFPKDGDSWHWVLMLLYRGMGIYCKGLPDPYLRLVQQMANDKQLAVVISDSQLVYGVSMPFRTSVVIDYPNLDVMTYLQERGRAGRRGLDKIGNVIHVKMSSKRLRELNISYVPNVTGSTNCLHYGMKIVEKLSKSSRWNNISSNMLVQDKIDNEDIVNFFEGIQENQEDDGIWDYINDVDNKYLLFLMWQFRQTDECLMLPLVLQHMEEAFANARSTEEIDQISVAWYLLHFIEIIETNEDNILPLHPLMLGKHKEFYDSMKNEVTGYAFDISAKIDKDLYQSIQENRCIPTETISEKHILRERISKFIYKLRAIQHYYYHMSFVESKLKSRYVNLCKLLGKLFTRLKWIYHTSSMLVEK